MDTIKSLTVYSTRGGNGKTITSLFLAIAAAKKGKKVALIDGDLEAPSLIHLLGEKTSKYSWVDYLQDRSIQASDLINKSKIENLYIIFSPPPKIGKAFLGKNKAAWWRVSLRRAIEAKQELQDMGFDLLIIDNQSGTSYNSLNNLVLTNSSIMVLRPATYGLGAAEGVLKEVIKSLKDMENRKDYYLWNQVHEVSDPKDKELLDTFLNKWDARLSALGLHKLGAVVYSNRLNLALLHDNPDLKEQFDHLEESYNTLFDTVFG